MPLNFCLTPVLLAMCLLMGCTKPLAYDFQDGAGGIVINCLFSPAASWRVHLGQPVGILSQDKPAIDSAEVDIMQGGTLIERLVPVGGGWYEGATLPSEGVTYTVRAAHRGQVAWATDSVPRMVGVAEATYTSFQAGDGETYLDFTVVLSDPPGDENLYEVLFFSPLHGRDSTSLQYYSDYVGTSQPILDAEGDLPYRPLAFLFSDQLFDGQACTLRMRFSNTTSGGAEQPGRLYRDRKRYVQLRSVSRAYYDFMRSWVRHRHNQQVVQTLGDDAGRLIFGGEVQPLAMNVTGGWGVFLGYQECVAELLPQ